MPEAQEEEEEEAPLGCAKTAEENEAVVRRLIEEFWNQGNPSALDEIFAADFVDHTPRQGTAGWEGAADTRHILLAMHAGFSDVQSTADDILTDGDKVAWRWTFHGSHTGELMGIPATGKRVTLTGITIDRMAGGRIAERWSQIDMLGVLQQLGAIPAPSMVS